jgi:hypothetical protein
MLDHSTSRTIDVMTKDEFYNGKTVAKLDWYLSECDLPHLVWARRRTFIDGTADACFEEGGKLFGFEHSDFASFILSEDEYRQFDGLDADDETEFGIILSEITAPDWEDRSGQDFEYLGRY